MQGEVDISPAAVGKWAFWMLDRLDEMGVAVIRFACPNCHRGFQVEDKAAGKKTKCPKCSAAISVPPAGDPALPRASVSTAGTTHHVQGSSASLLDLLDSLPAEALGGEAATAPLRTPRYSATRGWRPGVLPMAIGGLALSGTVLFLVLLAANYFSKAPSTIGKEAGGGPVVSSAPRDGPPDRKPPDTANAPERPPGAPAVSAASNQPAPAPEEPKPETSAPISPIKRLDPPSAEEQKRLVQEIDRDYKPDEAKDQGAKVALACRLLEDGRGSNPGRPQDFARLRRAAELARDAREPDLMLEAVDAMAASFNIRPAQVKSRLLQQLMEQGFSGDRLRACAASTSCVTLADEAVASGAMDEASRVLDAASDALAESRERPLKAHSASRSAKGRETNLDKAVRKMEATKAQQELKAIGAAQAAVARRVEALPEARRDYEAAQAARERLKAAPDAPEACNAVGRWLCFFRGEWNEGLKLLAKGSDQGLKSAAAMELASKPSKAEDKIARGNAWWELAEKATGRARSAMRYHAGHWYEEALAELVPGSDQTNVRQRLAQAGEEPLLEADEGPGRARPLSAVAPFTADAARLHQARWAEHLGASVTQTNSLGMKLVLIPPGEFLMGSPKQSIDEEVRLHQQNYDHGHLQEGTLARVTKPGTVMTWKTDPGWYRDHLPTEGPQHPVRLTAPYWLGATPVTQDEYQRVMGANPSKFQGDAKRPVEQASWDDATEFCRRLSQSPMEKAARRRYALPTEAQWEHACRAGNPGWRWFSDPAGSGPATADEDVLGEYGWFVWNSDHQTHAVAQKQANGWGLCDMYGNVGQWCQDFWGPDYYAKSPTDDPPGPPPGDAHSVFRGGGYHDAPWYLRSAFRNKTSRGYRLDYVGFRVACIRADK